MKKIISVSLAAAILFSVFSNMTSAADFGNPFCSSPSNGFFSPVESFGEMMVSLLARLFNKTDESDIGKAAELEKSWEAVSEDFTLDNCETVLETETWLANELTYISDKTYADSFNDVTLDLVLIGNGRKYTVPGFWDGGNTWKIRFACPSEGDWYFYTVCSDKDNDKLGNRTGKAVCGKYSGEYDIYKNGFLTTGFGKKYLTYDNGVPFFYLGDTHWGLGDETPEMVKTVCEKRKEQGFTVYQSEPIGEKFQLADGLTQEDMAGFANYDAKFKIIAQNGFVHANAQFFFPSDMETLIENFGGYTDNAVKAKINGKKVKLYDLSDGVKTYLEKLSRYWVARYSAFPVIWTLGQEVDNDFYRENGEHLKWGYANNPYKLVAEYIDKYDCYDHPLTAHQENTGATAAYGSGDGAENKQKVYHRRASPSSFRDVKAHTMYAAQWSPDKTKQFDNKAAKDYWFNSQGKPVVNYEGAYCMLWTKDFGSRMQGWCSYLSGMYGYGWGAHDTWCYGNTYNEDQDSSDGVDIITSQEKINQTWEDALECASGYQCGYTAKFLKNIEWYNLIPRFNNKSYFVPNVKVYYAYASNADNSEIVIYFYSFNDTSVAQKPNAGCVGAKSTGTVGNLERKQTYNYKWFNPITGEYTEEGTFTSTCAGTWYAGKKMGADMVLYIKKA